jgi:F0F1-type ATP synthase epsilon subunit
MPSSNSNFLNVIVRSRENIIYQGQARSVSSKNELGKFDVLPMHSNFISLLKSPIRIVEVSGNVRDIPITNALFKVDANTVSVFVGIEKI